MTKPGFDRRSIELAKEAEAQRVTVCCGGHLLMWYPAGATVDQVVDDLGRWASDPSYLTSLPWPVCCERAWTWDAGEELAIWRAGRLLALVARGPAGDVCVRSIIPGE